MASGGADVNENFMKACRDGDLVRFNDLLDSADVNYVSESLHGIKYTPLGISIVFNHEVIAMKLITHPKIDVNKKTCESTALHYACLRNNMALIGAICAKEGVMVNQKDYMNDGATPLAVAVKHKHVEAIRMLVKMKDVDLDILDSDGHSLDFQVKRVENSRNAEILYILDSARSVRDHDSPDSGPGGVLSWLGFSWPGEAAKKQEEEDQERMRKQELHEKELFELQALKEQEELKRRKMIEKSINSLLDSVDKKKEELANKENVLKELKLIHVKEKDDLQEEFSTKERLLQEKQNTETQIISGDKQKLHEELEDLESQLEEMMARQINNLVGEEGEPTLPCPECPVCLELLLPPMRIMQCSNGHLVCETCESKPELSSCPTCRQSFTGRATAMEQHLASLFT